MFFKKNKINNSVLGIDISSDEIRIVELERLIDETHRFKLVNYIIKSLPRGITHSDTSTPEELLSFMKNISKDEKLMGKKAVSAVSGASIITKSFKIPKDASERETESLIRNSAKTHHVKGIETMAFDFYENEIERTEEEKTIVLKLCPIEAIDGRELLMKHANIESIVIDVDDKAIEKISPFFYQQYAEETGYKINDDTIILLDLRRSKVITRIIKNNKVYNTEEFVFKFSNKEKEEDTIYKKIDSELKKISLLESTNDNVVKAVFLMGENSKLIKLKKHLIDDSKYLSEDIDVIISNPLVGIAYNGKNPSEVVDAAPSLVLACGLAMRNISKYE